MNDRLRLTLGLRSCIGFPLFLPILILPILVPRFYTNRCSFLANDYHDHQLGDTYFGECVRKSPYFDLRL